MGDSDDTMTGDLSGMIAPLSQGADMVLNRFSGGIKAGAMPFLHRYIGSPIINLILRVFFKVNVGDSQSGFRAFRRTLLDDLRLSSGGMELASEMIVRTAHGGFRSPSAGAYSARSGGQAQYVARRLAAPALPVVAAPDFLFILPGLFLFVLGALVFILSFISPSGVEIGSVGGSRSSPARSGRHRSRCAGAEVVAKLSRRVGTAGRGRASARLSAVFSLSRCS